MAQNAMDAFDRLLDVEGGLSVEAGNLSHRRSDGVLVLSGGVRIRGDDLDIRADHVRLDARDERVELRGAVQVLRGRVVLLAERVELSREQAQAVLERATILVKEDVGPQELGRCRSATGLVGSGRNKLRMGGQRWVRQGKIWKIEGARFTACDCGPGESPSWELRAGSADVLPGDRAWLHWPVLALKGLPVFVLPVAYLPLADRQTGFLMPRFNFSGRDGFVLSESLFVTLGPSADATFSLDWFEERGFRPRLEFRATPMRDSWIALRAGFIQDDKAAELTGTGARAAAERGSLELDTRLPLSAAWMARARVRLYSDSDISRDFSSGMDGRAADMAPSDLVVDWRGEDAWFGLDLSWRQDLRASGVDLLAAASPEVLERLGSDPVGDTIQRLGAFDLRWLRRSIADWPLSWSMRLEGANLSALQAAWRDWGIDGTPNQREPAYSGSVSSDFGADDGPGGEGDGQLGDGELRRAFRILLAPRLDLNLLAGELLQIEAQVGHRQFVYLPHGPEAPGASTRGVSMAGLSLGTEIGRLYRVDEADPGIGHTFSPRLRLLGAWRGLAQGQVRHVLDAEDRLLDDAAQLLLELESGLHWPQAGIFSRILSLRLWQALDLRGTSLGQAAGEVGVDFKLVSGRVTIAWDWRESRLAEVDTQLRLADGRGDSLRLAYLYLPSLDDALGRPLPLSERTARELGLLFGLSPAAYRGYGESLQVLGADARIALMWGLSAHGGVHVNLQDLWIDWFDAGLAYRSNCHCWATSVTVRKWRGQDLPDVFFWIDLSVLGRAGGSSASRF